MTRCCKIAALILLITLNTINAFSPPKVFLAHSPSMSTTTAPPPEKTRTDRKTNSPNERTSDNDDDGDSVVRYNDAPLEYLVDDTTEARNPEDPFHILLLDTTFTKNKDVTQSYVSGCLSYVLGMPADDASELTKMAASNGVSCLGTWRREECLSLGRKLQVRDLHVRVVPFCEGGGRSWQAKAAFGRGSATPGNSESVSFQ